MSIAYGIDIKESEDPYISVAEEAVSQISQAGVPGTFWVDFFPILKYVPSWFPGAGFQKIAARARVLATSMTEQPFRYVKEQLVRHHFLEISRAYLYPIILKKNGTAAPSIAASLIKRLPDEGDPQRLAEETVAKDVAMVAYAGLSPYNGAQVGIPTDPCHSSRCRYRKRKRMPWDKQH